MGDIKENISNNIVYYRKKSDLPKVSLQKGSGLRPPLFPHGNVAPVHQILKLYMISVNFWCIFG